MGTWTFESLTQAPLQELEEILRAGHTPQVDSLAGWEFRGFNVVPPVGKLVVKLLGIQRFAKGFYRDGDEIRGYNVDIQRGRVDEPWAGKPTDEHPRRRAYYRVYPPGEGQRRAEYPGALFLEYVGRPHNGIFDGGGLYGDGGLRDYVVLADSNNPDLLVGKAFYHLPPLRVVGGYFVAERLRQHDLQQRPHY